MSDMKYYTITLTVEGPVHIGSGREILKKDCLYMSNERKVYILDNMKVFEGMKKLKLLADYEKYLMDEKQKNFTFFVKNYNISPAEYKGWTAYTLPLNDIADSSKGGGSDNIAEFVKDSYGCPYIPGSSLKGALRTVIEGTLCERDKEKYKYANKIENAEYRNRRSYLAREEKELSQKLFYTVGADEERPRNAVNDMFRGLRISDSVPLSTDDLVLCSKIDRSPKGINNVPPLKRECLKPGTKIVFDMEIDLKYFKFDANSIIEFADAFYKNYRKNFLSVFPKLDSAETVGGHRIYIGGGSGFATKTVVYPLFEDRDRAVRSVQKIMINTTSTRKTQDPHKHYTDAKRYHVSPHMRKCTKHRGVYYDFGLCSIDILEKV